MDIVWSSSLNAKSDYVFIWHLQSLLGWGRLVRIVALTPGKVESVISRLEDLGWPLFLDLLACIFVLLLECTPELVVLGDIIEMVVQWVTFLRWDQALPRHSWDLRVALTEDVFSLHLGDIAHVAGDVVSGVAVGDGVELVLIILKVLREEACVAYASIRRPRSGWILILRQVRSEGRLSWHTWCRPRAALSVERRGLWSRRYLCLIWISRLIHIWAYCFLNLWIK